MTKRPNDISPNPKIAENLKERMTKNGSHSNMQSLKMPKAAEMFKIPSVHWTIPRVHIGILQC